MVAWCVPENSWVTLKVAVSQPLGVGEAKVANRNSGTTTTNLSLLARAEFNVNVTLMDVRADVIAVPIRSSLCLMAALVSA